MILLASIPILVFIFIFLVHIGRASTESQWDDWRGSFLAATVIWGLLVTVFAEGLGLFDSITQVWLTLAWAAALLIILVFGATRGWIAKGARVLKAELAKIAKFERLLIVALAGIALMLLAVAVISPPNNVDSLIYHMTKVVHWASNQNMDHFAASNHAQLMRPHWAEMAILNLRVLFGSDRLANLVQWFSMVGSIIGVTGIAKLLGADRWGQLFTAAAAISIPMGILQSTSTQNDYVSAFWIICIAYFVVLGKRRTLYTSENVILGLAFALGLLTKGTFFAFAPPLIIWHFLPRISQIGFWSVIKEGAVVIVLAALINLPFWTRNIVTYGGPYGPTEALQRSIGFPLPKLDFDFLRGEQGSETNLPKMSSPRLSVLDLLARPEHFVSAIERDVTKPGSLVIQVIETQGSESDVLSGISELAKRLLQMLGWNLVTPSSALNSAFTRMMANFPDIYGQVYLGMYDLQAWNHEDSAGNPLHLTLVPLSLVILAVWVRRSQKNLAFQYALVSLAAYALVPIVMTTGAGPFGVRHQLPFFVLWSPVIGVAASVIRRDWMKRAGILILVLAALPYGLLNNTRPIIGRTPWPTRIRSVFLADQPEILLAIAPELKEPYSGVRDIVMKRGCNDVGLRIDSGDLEYAFWWLFEAPQSGVTIKTLHPVPELEGLIDGEFSPCAVICTICEGRPRLHGLELYTEYSGVAVYFGDEFAIEPEG